MSQTLVLVHGFMGSALNWGPILTRLKARPELIGWSFVTPDLLGHGGRRGPDSTPYTRLDHATLVEDLKLQLPKSGGFVAMGHSFGIRPLLSLAADPDWGARMEGLIVEDASPEITPENAGRLHSILSRVPTPFRSRDDARQKIQELFPNDSRLAAFLFSNIRPSSPETHDWRFDRSGLLELLNEASTSPLWSEWSKYSGPVFVFQGEHSDHLTAERLERALKHRDTQNTQAIQIAQSGHWIHSDQPDAFTDELVKVLKNF